MIKEIDRKDITEDNKTFTSGEKDISQDIVTSEEVIEQIEEPTGNAIDKNTSIESKFGPKFMTTETYESHSFAEIFPDAAQAEYESLLEDMRVHGQYEPVIVFEGKIADGRTRQKAQQELQQPMEVHEWLGRSEELLNYLHAKSQHRNLNSQQRAVISLQFLKAEKELAEQRRGMRTDLEHIVVAVKGRATEITAKKHGTNRTYLSYAETIQTKAEELLDYVKRNEIPIGQAKLLAEKLDDKGQRLEAVKAYKKGKQTMKAIINDIKFKDNPAHDISEQKQDNNERLDTIPALMLFQHMNLWQEKEVATEKIRQIAEILNINTREIWYIPDNEQNTTKEILKLVQALAKKIAKLNKFSSDGNVK